MPDENHDSGERGMDRPPREGLVRALYPGVELLRDADGGMPVLRGHFAVFNQDTEINSKYEGRFIERIAPGAFTKTFNENRDGMRVLFQHGRDPQVGDKPLGPIQTLSQDERGAYYEVPLLDTSYNRDLLPGLQAGLYGASFRFSVVREDYNDRVTPGPSNPDGIPERTVREARVSEFGPVTFPAYAGATAGVRSLTDLIHDVDAIVAATPILLDEERTTRARIFLTRPIPSEEERAQYSTDQRAEMAKRGEAIPIKNAKGEIVDGSYPIANASDLENAIQAFGRAGDKAEVKAHILKRARALGRTDLIPDSWQGGADMNSAEPDSEAEERADSSTAPSTSAEQAPEPVHPQRERRGKHIKGLYGPKHSRKEPKWLL